MMGLEALPGIIRGLLSHHVPAGSAGTVEPGRGLCWVCPSCVPRPDAPRACRARHHCWDRSAPCPALAGRPCAQPPAGRD